MECEGLSSSYRSVRNMAASPAFMDHGEHLGSAGIATFTTGSGELESTNRHHANPFLAASMAASNERQTGASLCPHTSQDSQCSHKLASLWCLCQSHPTAVGEGVQTGPFGGFFGEKHPP